MTVRAARPGPEGDVLDVDSLRAEHRRGRHARAQHGKVPGLGMGGEQRASRRVQASTQPADAEYLDLGRIPTEDDLRRKARVESPFPSCPTSVR